MRQSATFEQGSTSIALYSSREQCNKQQQECSQPQRFSNCKTSNQTSYKLDSEVLFSVCQIWTTAFPGLYEMPINASLARGFPQKKSNQNPLGKSAVVFFFLVFIFRFLLEIKWTLISFFEHHRFASCQHNKAQSSILSQPNPLHAKGSSSTRDQRNT